MLNNKLLTYVISMSEVRREPLMHQIRANSNLKVILSPGVDAKQLMFNKELVSPWRYKFFVGRSMWPGELGCTLAHIQTVEMFLAEENSWALILEDNTNLPEDRISKIIEVVAFVEAQKEYMNYSTIVQLHTGSDKTLLGECVYEADEIRIYESLRLMGPTKALLINRKAAQLCLQRSFPIMTPPDFPLWFALSHFLVIEQDLVEVNPNSISEIGPSRSTLTYFRDQYWIFRFVRKIFTIMTFIVGLEWLIYRVIMGPDFYIAMIFTPRFLRIASSFRKNRYFEPCVTKIDRLLEIIKRRSIHKHSQ